MKTKLQTILGANGVIGRELSKLLPAHTDTIRQVSRRPKKTNPGDETVAADLLDAGAVAAAVAGSQVVYLVAGLKYETKVWREQWPVVMRNAVDACKRHRAKLVFFDNVYAYGRVDGAMTEDTPLNPCSQKGEVRAQIATLLMDEIKRGELEGMIVRSADFYGPGATLSMTQSTVTERLKAGRTPQWIGDARAQHSFTYTPDAARSLAVLGNVPSAFGRVWHALTSEAPMTGELYVRAACAAAGRPYGLMVAPRWMLSIVGLWVPALRETKEMLYQFEHDYRFDSGKLQRAFSLEATTYRVGIEAAIRAG
jgi:nucleoside-diphosphate-sugar epimerase